METRMILFEVLNIYVLEIDFELIAKKYGIGLSSDSRNLSKLDSVAKLHPKVYRKIILLYSLIIQFIEVSNECICHE